jgi:hypothetical protein
MMMRYLGWGIGHRNPPDFSHEANVLIASSSDGELEQYEIQPTAVEGGELEGGEITDREDSDSDVESVQEAEIYDY